MVKHTQTIRRLLLTNCLSVFDHFVVLTLKGLNCLSSTELDFFLAVFVDLGRNLVRIQNFPKD